MRKRLSLLFSSLLLCLSLATTGFAADFDNLVILHTNDSHGYDAYSEKGKNIGMAGVAQIREDLIAQGYDVLLVDAGDFSQDNNLVNFSKGHAAIDFMNAAGYDVAILGNHEFDYGEENILLYASEADFPIINCNVIMKDTGSTLLAPHAIIQKGDTRIGLVGMLTPSTKDAVTASHIDGLDIVSMEDLYARVQAEVDFLKARECDLIVAVGHLGNFPANKGNCSKDILNNVQGIDLFIDGHDHRVVNEYTDDGILLAETGNYTNRIGKITYKNGKWEENFVEFEPNISQKKAVTKIIKKEADIVDKAMSEVIAKTDFLLEGNWCPGVRDRETNLGDLIADAYYWQAKQVISAEDFADTIVIQNGAGIRDTFQPGDITMNNVTAVLPFSNTLYGVRVTGKSLLEMLESATQSCPEYINAFPQIANAKITIDTKVPFEKKDKYPDSKYFIPANPGARVTINEIDGKPFDINKEYNIIMIEFLVQGGDAYGLLKNPDTKLAMIPIGYNDRDAFINYIRDALGGVIPAEYAEPQGRVTILK